MLAQQNQIGDPASLEVEISRSVDPFVGDASLLEHNIRKISRTDVRIDRKLVPVDWAVPDFMIALAGPVESTLMTLKYRLKASRVAGHLRGVRHLNPFLPRMEIEHNFDDLIGLQLDVVQNE